MKFFFAACFSLLLCCASQAQTTDAAAAVATGPIRIQQCHDCSTQVAEDVTAELNAPDESLSAAPTASSATPATSNLKRRHLTITCSSLPTATQGMAYSATLTATGGTPPYTWAVSSGNLPPGLSLSSAGVISGISTDCAGCTTSFSITVTDSGSVAAARIKSKWLLAKKAPRQTATIHVGPAS